MIKKAFKKLICKVGVLLKPSVIYCSENLLLPAIFTKTSSKDLRSLMMLPESKHFTQLNQDIFALLCNRFANGYFLEIGANDGYNLSNTVYLEEEFGWNGLLVEANPKYTESLKSRKSKSSMVAITEKNENYQFSDAGLYGGLTDLLDKTHFNRTKEARTISVKGVTLKNLLEDNMCPKTINFISIDVEGAEVSIVEQLCKLEDYRFVCGCIEHNNRPSDYKLIKELLGNSGYRVVWNEHTSHDLFFIDQRNFKLSDC